MQMLPLSLISSEVTPSICRARTGEDSRIVCSSQGRPALASGWEQGKALLLIGTIILLGSLWFIRQHDKDLEMKAERAFPGPVKSRTQLKRSTI